MQQTTVYTPGVYRVYIYYESYSKIQRTINRTHTHTHTCIYYYLSVVQARRKVFVCGCVENAKLPSIAVPSVRSWTGTEIIARRVGRTERNI